MMRLERSRFGEDVPVYDSPEEEEAALRSFRDGAFGTLTCAEIAFFRDVQADPDGIRWAAAHAGRPPDDFGETELNGVLLTEYPLDEPLDVSRRRLAEAVGPRPLTPLAAWCVRPSRTSPDNRKAKEKRK